MFIKIAKKENGKTVYQVFSQYDTKTPIEEFGGITEASNLIRYLSGGVMTEKELDSITMALRLKDGQRSKERRKAERQAKKEAAAPTDQSRGNR